MKPSGHLLMLSLLIVLLIISITPICQSCLLCYFRLPKRPKSIDYLWPTVLEDINIPETATEMCEMSQRLPFTTNCRNGLAKIFCTLANFMDNNWHDCYLENAEYEECVKCSQNKTDIIRQTSWVITWLDSLGKMPPAVSEGNYYWLGDYEQCSVLRQTNAFDGRYCRIVLEIPDIETYRYCPQSDPLDIYLGFCAPSMCTPQEIIQLAQMVTPYAIRAECETPLDWPLSSRIFLILPVFAFIVFFMTFLYERLSSGPIWIHNNLIERCKNSWWKNILFINNFFSSEQTCLDGGYLYSLIVQFYLLLLPMLYLSKRYNTAILAITVSCFFASVIYTFFVMSTTKLSPTLLLTADPISPEIYNTYTDLLYTRPWARAPAFIIGFLFSFLFVDQTPINNDLLWLARFILFLFGAIVIFGLYPYSIGNSTPQIYLAAYSAFHRPLWAFIVCSLVYLGYRNRNIGGLSQFLEWRLFSPFARNIFVVFLISEPVSLYLFSSLHRPLHATIWSLLNIAIGTIILSNFVAFLLDIFISMPIQNIVSELIRDKRCDTMIHADNAHLTFISKTKPDIK
ncbi:unnamed protein product [Onchocerca ochengi]|uniref:NRF domain-containing protein n=1 Tax=Onchocerca ochengi TaxID=42157 RepID=A0A182E1G3_ONCOC|nr:unnamed protein product [Onchocerca ochengi]